MPTAGQLQNELWKSMPRATQQTCLCVTQRTFLLCDTADMSAVSDSRRVCCVTTSSLAEVCCLLVESYSNSSQVWSSRSFLQLLWGLRRNILKQRGCIQAAAPFGRNRQCGHRALSGPLCSGTKGRTLPYLPPNLQMRNCRTYMSTFDHIGSYMSIYDKVWSHTIIYDHGWSFMLRRPA